MKYSDYTKEELIFLLRCRDRQIKLLEKTILENKLVEFKPTANAFANGVVVGGSMLLLGAFLNEVSR